MTNKLLSITSFNRLNTGILLFILFCLMSIKSWGQTATYSFSSSGASSGFNNETTVDSNISFESFRNSGTTNPALNSGQLRLYQHATKGGSIKIYAHNGATITKVVVNASGNDGMGPAGYTQDGGTATNLSISNGNYTMNTSATGNVEFYCRGNSSSNRIYANSFTVTYTLPVTTPTITLGDAATGLNYVQGSGPSTGKPFTVSGENLTANVTLTAPADFELSTSLAGPYSNSLSITASGTLAAVTRYVRLKAGLVAGNYSGNISASSTDATTKTISASGTVTAPAVWIEADPNVAHFGNVGTGTVSSSITSDIFAENLTGNILVNSENSAFQISSNGTTWVSQLTLARDAGNEYMGTLYIRFNTTVEGNQSGKITFTVGGTVHEEINFSGTGVCTALPVTPTDSFSVSNNPSCGPATLNYTGTAPAGETYYWQTTANGVSIATPVSASQTISTTGSRFVRSRNNTSRCWSDAVQSPSVTILVPITFSAHPSSTVRTVCVGTGFTSLSVSASGTGNSFQWYSNTSNSNTGGTLITNATSSTYTPPSNSVGANYYYVVVSNTNACNPVTSNVSGLHTVGEIPLMPSGSITADATTACEAVTLSYDGALPGDGTLYWQTSASGTSTTTAISEGTRATTLSTSGTRWIRTRSAAGCWSTAVSSPAITIQNPVAITTQPANQSATNSNTSSFSVTATGTATLTYQWQQKIGNASWTVLTGATGATYTIPATTLAMNGRQYRVIITNSCGSVISTPAALTVIDGPCLEEGFSSAIGYTTGTVTLDSGTWDFNDALIQNQGGNFEVQLRSATGTAITTPSFGNGIQTLNFKAYRTSGSGSALQVNYSTDGGATWQPASESPYNLNTSKTDYTATITTAVPTLIRFYRTAGTLRLDDIAVFCTVIPDCTPATITATPASGPAGTVVTINGSNFSTSSVVNFGSVSAATTFISASQIKAVVPTGAATGPITVDTDLDCDSEVAFAVTVQDGSACVGALSIPNVPPGTGNLVFYELFDTSANNSGLITLLNASYQNINLADYQISRDGDGNGSEEEVPAWHLPSGILAPGQVYVFSAGSASQCAQYPAFDGGTPANTGLNDNDRLRILRADNLAIVDEVVAPSYSGYYLLRNHYAVNPTHNNSDWNINSSGACRSGLGVSPFMASNPILPVINMQPVINYTSCDAASLSVSAGVSNSGTPDLSYQWFVNTPGSSNWTMVSNAAAYSGATTTTLVINSLAGMDQNQYYVQVRQGGVVCQVPSVANQLLLSDLLTAWNGTSWSSGLPTVAKTVRLDADYDTNTADLVACSLDLNNHTLVINANQHATIYNGISGTGHIAIANNGSLIQVADGVANGTDWTMDMERITQDMFRYDFTYWGSPLTEDSEFSLKELSPGTLFDKYFEWDSNGANWSMHNYGAHDMIPGRGYIVRAPQNYAVEGNGGAAAQKYTAHFTGKPNNGIVTHDVTGITGEDKWNLLSNPYPSAINIEEFLEQNKAHIDGTIYLWTHNTRLLPNTDSTDLYHYSPSDYASYNLSGAVATKARAAENEDNPDADHINSNLPTAFLPAGQAFFVKGLSNGTVSFSNRHRGGSNNNFFRPSPTTPIDNWDMKGKHRVWLNLAGTNAFNQIMVGYIENATNGMDWGYDGLQFAGNKVTLYSILDGQHLVIQGKALPFNNQDVVPLGYNTTLTGNLTISIDHMDGLFVGQAVYLEDKLLDISHNLKLGAYSFATAPGTFNERFQLRYVPTVELGNPEYGPKTNDLMVYKNNGAIVIKSDLESLDHVTVYDLLGRVVFEKRDVDQNLLRIDHIVMNEQPLIVKVQLENGAIVNKKIVY